ncbi:hypothetical protein K493DRAFT_308719 [Basidiobolus meristosporus CBS 931.73]|uniref:Fibronectin type-III domain-containing protein n=1 Tax=Basidiobolus meristosporus CBS 931.73 TaxID=1314790 RepID=A0A1Y1WYB7_9FUNG|nr:hypothetical protein K493DRAFT_308719 [Basidiobolus meristosporus CBS 931.73]|eukprot:ORX78318.1 hypothetical protein K493DRAFT_308719 [Basidiobolus meristosporus CBS 931.73]
MKSILLPIALLACFQGTTEALPTFDKHQPWGKRDYSCVVFNTPAEGARLKPGRAVTLRWELGEDCGLSGDSVTTYDLRLYNSLEYTITNGAPLVKDTLHTTIAENLNNQTFTYKWKVPNISTQGVNPSLYYVRVTTSSVSNPQQPTLFGIAGPFTIGSS